MLSRLWRKWTPHSFLEGMWTGVAALENRMENLLKTKTVSTI